MKNYKTTIAGFFVALLNLLANGISVRQAIFSASMLILGMMAKDYDLKGGTRSAETKKEELPEEFKIKDSKIIEADDPPIC